MSETDIPTDQQNKETPEKESGSKSLPTIWNRAKEKYKAYCCNTYVHCKKWLSRPWWFQETDPIARFTGWVAAFTFVLVLVSFLQFCTLQSTDKTTRDALTASNRAWIAPTNATITSPEKDKPLTITVFYVNTGHSPAFSVIGYHAHSTFSSSDWNNGTASRALDKFVTEGFNFTQLPPESEVVYPTINST